MKHLKILTLLFISVVIMSCSKSDSEEENPADNATFNVSINGSSFNNYNATLGFYVAEIGISGNSLGINVTDSNNNVINLFLNASGGLASGTTKQIGDVDADNFATSAVIRDQVAQVTYYGSSGSITITKSIENPSDSDYRLISGTFNITAPGNNSTTVTMTGSFSDFEYSN